MALITAGAPGDPDYWERDYIRFLEYTTLLTSDKLDELIKNYGLRVVEDRPYNHRGHELNSVVVLTLLARKKEGVAV